MPFQKYIEDIQNQYNTGIAREHAYRPALKILIEDIMPDVTAVNDPAHIQCGAPDYILHQNKIDVGYIEAKDIDNDLSKTEKTDQLKRYLESLDNLILTDYLEFRFYLNGEKVDVIRIGEIENGQVKPIPENYDRLKTLLLDFSAFQGQTIKSAKKLAEMMAHKAKLMKHVFHNVILAEEDSSLKDQLKVFQKVLMHDMTEEQFADVYAQTIAYGLFTARLHDKTKESFSRSEALLLIPKSNPFLRQLFSYIAGPELEERVVWIVDALCEVFLFSDLDKILEDFGSSTGQKDPMLHFYETFLAKYDKSLRKARGVWYTPEPVVNFIVRAIDEVLKTHFGLKDGIADKSKIKIKVDAQKIDNRTKSKKAIETKEVHKVQLLDVATGTGTFLAETVKQIYKKYKGQEGIWSSYVENDLLPRMHGFELLMASYAMCHMKLDLLLQETGYKPSNEHNPPRLSVYLTNSLEEHHPEMDSLFASWLSREANEASWIKKNMPIMVAFGNPPYSVSSTNKGEWIQNLIQDYKVGLKEKKINLDDDYIKFIRYAEHYVERTGYGIVSMITNNSFLSGVTHRQLRIHLMETFDEIYIYDLHGNSKQKEKTPDGLKDDNVFDIQQGVCIFIFIKHNNSKQKLANIYHFDSYGSRSNKYNRLISNNISSTPFKKLSIKKPYCFFVPKNYEALSEYENGFSITELFLEYNTGIQTKKDAMTIYISEKEREEVISYILNNDIDEINKKYKIKEDGVWTVQAAQSDLVSNNPQYCNIAYRPFDTRYTAYTGKSSAFHGRPRHRTMKHMINGNNIALLTARQNKSGSIDHFFVTDNLSEMKCAERTIQSYHFPLYLFHDGALNDRHPNLDSKIYSKFKDIIPNLEPEALFDYIYAVLHAPKYRKRYTEFLKTDFPRIPYSSDQKKFDALAKKGAELRELHLMESEKLDELITTYPVDGDHELIKPCFEDGKVWINTTQYFGNVPKVAWEFYIGGYQPAQKWLKDRKGRNLTLDDIMHYQRIIVALTETDHVMKEIDKIDFLPKS